MERITILHCRTARIETALGLPPWQPEEDEATRTGVSLVDVLIMSEAPVACSICIYIYMYIYIYHMIEFYDTTLE